MNVLYADGGGEERRRTGGGSTSGSLERDGRAASTIHATTTTTTTRRALEQDVAGVRIAHCSWCLAECAHAQVSEGFLLFRAAYRCGACAETDRAVPRTAVRRARERRQRIDRPERRRPLPRPPRDHPGVARPGWVGRGIRRVDEGPPRAEGVVLVVPGRRGRHAPIARLVRADSFAPASSSNGRSIVGAESFSCGGCARRTVRCETCERAIAAAKRALRETTPSPKPATRGALGASAWCTPRERAARRQRGADEDRTRVVRVVRRAVRAPGEGQGAAKCQCRVRRGNRAVRRCPGRCERGTTRLSRNVSSRVRGFSQPPERDGDVPPMRGDARDAERRRGEGGGAGGGGRRATRRRRRRRRRRA